jgi:hypothetical protein|tara:strand:- start:2104 stop:2760 length:657 start_codon:yes stop_codon:yes gene_type:complete
MYLSHKHKFLFLRTPKTASSSLSDFFIRNIQDDEAIYTEVEDSNLPGTLDEAIVSKYRPYAFYHFTLNQLIDEGVITREQVAEYDIFALLRNPVDRAKSFYYFYRKWKGRQIDASIDQYRNWTINGVFKGEPNSGIVQSSLLKLGKKDVGRFWLYEDLEKELSNFMFNRRLRIDHPLPRHKTDSRVARQNEIEFEQKDIDEMKKTFGEDFKLYEEITK